MWKHLLTLSILPNPLTLLSLSPLPPPHTLLSFPIPNNLLLLLPFLWCCTPILLILCDCDCCLDPLPGCEGVTSRYYTTLHEWNTWGPVIIKSDMDFPSLQCPKRQKVSYNCFPLQTNLLSGEQQEAVQHTQGLEKDKKKEDMGLAWARPAIMSWTVNSSITLQFRLLIA